MKAIGFMRMLSGVAVVSSLVLGGVPASASVLDQTKKVAGVTVHYKVVLPDGYDASKEYPGIIAFGGGPQTMNTVDGILSRNFRVEAEKRGYIVVAPAAPNGDLFFEEGETDIPGVPEDDTGGLQDSGREVSHRGTIERRHRIIPRRSCQSAIFHLDHRFPRIHVGTDAGEASGDLEDVRLHVCRRKRRVSLAS